MFYPFQEETTMLSNWDAVEDPWAAPTVSVPSSHPLNRPLPVVPGWDGPTEGVRRLILTHGIPSEAMPQERSRKWGHKRVADSTIEKTHELLLLARPAASATLSLHRAYTRWRRANGLDTETPGRCLAIFGSYLVEAELAFTTCATYVRTLLSLGRKEADGRAGCEWYVVQDILRALDLSAAKETPDHAIDIDEERAKFIIDSIREPDVQFAVWAMCTIGGRISDLNNFGEGQVFFRRTSTPQMFSVDFRVTKIGRTQCEKYSVTLPVWLPWNEKWNVLLASRKPFPADTDRVNRILHAAGFKETSYSFRRLFVNRIVDRFTEKGITEWCRVIEFTGHQQARMAKGTYKIPDAQRQLKKVGPKKNEGDWVFD